MTDQIPHLLASRLSEPLSEPLPGPMAGSRFESHPRLWRSCDSPPSDARRAAVLVLLYPHEGEWHVPLTLRPAHLAVHAGQVSLPGGAIEPGETSRQAALREFREELGGNGQEITLLGKLSPLYIHASNFLVTPWVGTADERPELVPNPDEVAEVLEIPLAHMIDPANLDSHIRHHEGQPYTAPHFAWQSYQIWGATCLILGELVTLLEEIWNQQHQEG